MMGWSVLETHMAPWRVTHDADYDSEKAMWSNLMMIGVDEIWKSRF